MLDNDTLLFTITDLKQYIYCPRIFYYHSCLPDIRPTTYKMWAGIEAHEDERKRSARRSFHLFGEHNGERYFDVAVQSTALHLSGQIDEVVKTDKEWIPLDYKLARQAGFHFKVQLAAYAMLLEATFQCQVRRGFLYLIPSKQAVEVPMTAKLRKQVQQAVLSMRSIADQEQMPDPTDWRQRCLDCEFRRFCNDV
jgi:CRISPR-associated exonuclease Cas4